MSEDPAAPTLIVPHERPVSAAQPQLPADPHCGERRGGFFIFYSGAAGRLKRFLGLSGNSPPEASSSPSTCCRSPLWCSESWFISRRQVFKSKKGGTIWKREAQGNVRWKRSSARQSAPVNYVLGTSFPLDLLFFYDSLYLSCLLFKTVLGSAKKKKKGRLYRMLNTVLVSGLLTFPAEVKFAHSANLCCHQLGLQKENLLTEQTVSSPSCISLSFLFCSLSRVTLRVPPLINVSHKAGETKKASMLDLTNKLCFISSSLLQLPVTTV